MRVRTLGFYVFREILFHIFVAFLFFFFIYFVNQLLILAERILSRKVPFWDVALMIFYSIPFIITLALPFGTLVGSLMAVGRMSSQLEIMAIRGSGISLLRIFVPILILGIILFLFAFVFSDYFLPLGNLKYKTMFRQALYRNPGVELEPFSVKKIENDTVIITGDVIENTISDLVIIDKTKDNKKRIITAEEAVIEPASGQRNAHSFKLTEDFTHLSDQLDEGEFEYVAAETMIYNLLVREISSTALALGAPEKSSIDVWNEIQIKRENLLKKEQGREESIKYYKFALVMQIRAVLEKTRYSSEVPDESRNALQRSLEILKRERSRSVIDRSLQTYLLEFHRKFSSPFSCVVFIVFAFPVGLYARKSGRLLGFGIGILMSAVYWGMLLVSYRLGSRMNVSPIISMWAPNFLVLSIGLILLIRKVRR